MDPEGGCTVDLRVGSPDRVTKRAVNWLGVTGRLGRVPRNQVLATEFGVLEAARTESKTCERMRGIEGKPLTCCLQCKCGDRRRDVSVGLQP